MLSDEARLRQKKQSYVESRGKGQEKQAAQAMITDKEAEGQDNDEEEGKEEVMIVTRGSVAKKQQKSQEETMSVELANAASFNKILKD